MLSVAGCGSGHAKHTRRSAFETEAPIGFDAYSALASHSPSGIAAVTSVREARKLAAKGQGPIWITAKHGTRAARFGPVIMSARVVQRRAQMRLWIAKSGDRGICVLLFRPEGGPQTAASHALVANCGSASELAEGTTIVQRSLRGPHKFLVAGVTPDGVTSVDAHLQDGKILTIPVVSNSYYLSVGEAVKAVAFSRDGIVHEVTFNTGGK